jgi:hypothetical protein
LAKKVYFLAKLCNWFIFGSFSLFKFLWSQTKQNKSIKNIASPLTGIRTYSFFILFLASFAKVLPLFCQILAKLI